MSEEVLVKVENVSKKFCRSLKKSLWYGVQDIGKEIAGRVETKPDPRPDEFWALREISFELRRGECLGLIGANGAGKTTLLRLLNGLIKPDTGMISLQGQVGALIALGAGFNPVLTGRENIYVSGSVLGLTKREINHKLEDIIKFSELQEFIDMPVQSYSSGMRVRLGFAVATTMTPDVLLIDEVLAVGDRGFRVKCFNRISEIQDDCATILVSHNMIDIQSNCDMVIVLESGRIKHYGEKLSGIRIYNSLCSENQNFNVVSPMGIELITFMLNTPEIGWRDNLRFRVELNSPIEVNECILRIVFRDTTSLENLAEWRSIHHGENVQINFGKNVMEGCIEDIHLGAGDYIVDLIIASENDIIQFLATEGYNLLFVNSNIYGHTVYQI